MKILLIIVYLSGGYPIMESSMHDDVMRCYLAGIDRINKLTAHARVQVEFARCVAVTATQVRKGEKNKNG